MQKNKQASMASMREVIALALPIVISHACYTIMTFTDRLFLARIDSAQMNAAMGGGLSVYMLITLFLGVIGYSTALVAQYFGAGMKSKCAVVLTQTVIVSVLAYPIILLLRPLGVLLFEHMGIVHKQLVYQKIYFNILLSAAVVPLLRTALASFFSGIGRTKVVMVASFTAMIVNVIANYILIFGKLGFPALEIRGAAYGTVFGGVSGVLVLLGTYLAKHNSVEYTVRKSFCFVKETMNKLLRFGYPAGIEMFLNMLAFNIIIMLFHSRGLVAATATTIMFNWDMVSFIPLLGLQIGVTSLVGRYMGMQSPDLAHQSTISGLKLGWIYSILTFVLFVFFPVNLVNLFKPEGNLEIFFQTVPVAVFMIRVAVLYIFVEAVMLVFSGALRGAGDTLWAMLLSVGLHWILVPVLFLMLRVFNLSIQISWVTLIIIFVIFSFLFYLRYRGGKWRKIRMVLPQEEALTKVNIDFHESADL